MRELGIDLIITMGRGDRCPVNSGKCYPDWDLADPKGRSIDEMRATRAEITGRVNQLLTELLLPASR